MAMVQLGRPSLVALYVRGFYLFCKRTRTSLQPGKDRLYSIPLVLSNEKLPFHIGFEAVQAVRSRNFCVQATTEASDSGQVNFSLIQSMEKKIKENLNAESVVVRDAYGDGRHVSIDVISTAFEGQSAVSRQRMVYKSIWEELQNTVHAVDQMTTRTPAEAGVGE